MDWENAFLWFVTVIISLTVHEAAHALFAKLGGDPTAYRLGQVTLNPLPHIQREKFGMVVIPLLSLYVSGGNSCFGFASTPIDPVWAYHHPRKAALMSAAGPLANLVLAAIAFAVLWFLGRPDSDAGAAVRLIAGVFLMLNLLLALFNFVPLPPLDGAGILSGLATRTRPFFDNLQRVPWLPIVLLLLVIYYLPYLYWPVFDTVNGWLPYPFRLG
jgi:Zn-dependent protease